MKRIKLVIPLKPYSLNKMYYRDGKIKKTEARNWENAVIEYLRDEKTQKDLEQFRESFNPKKHYLEIHLLFLYPKELLFTREGSCSSKVFDATNVEKPLVDVIFLKSHSISRIRNLEIDDKFIMDLVSKKRSAEKHRMEITIYIKDLQDLQDTEQP